MIILIINILKLFANINIDIDSNKDNIENIDIDKDILDIHDENIELLEDIYIDKKFETKYLKILISISTF